MIIGVQKAEYLEDFKIKITFDNHQIKIVDLAGFIEGAIFEPLKDIDYFKKVKIDKEIDTICWENGADFSPEFLYEIGR